MAIILLVMVCLTENTRYANAYLDTESNFILYLFVLPLFKT